jgi:hypothetical protein
LRVRFSLIAVATFAATTSAATAVSQEQHALVARDRTGVNVQIGRDGRLDVAATDAPLDEVIRAVAVAAGFRVSFIGALPRQRVTVFFPDSRADEIVASLMNPAGLSYILTRGDPAVAPQRLIVASLPAHAPVQWAGIAALPASAREDPAVIARGAVSENEATPAQDPPVDPSHDTTAREQHDAMTRKDAPAAEWPAGIEPANSGAPVSLPQTREALFLQVNGSEPVELPPGVTPNIGAPRSEATTPANRSGSLVPPGVAVPGTTMPANVSAPTAQGAGQAAADVAMTAPKTIRVPGPVVIRFPPRQ